MANAVIHFSRGSRFILKGTIFIIFGVALFSIFSFTYRRYANTGQQTSGLIEDIARRDIGGGEHGIVAPVHDAVGEEHKVHWDGWDENVYDKTTCYSRLVDGQDDRRCLPSFLMIQTPGVLVYGLKNCLSLHDYILTGSQSNYFSKYPNMEGVKTEQLEEYLESFTGQSDEIMTSADPNKYIIGDEGVDLARPYVEEGVSGYYVPGLLLHSIIGEMNPGIKFIYLIRDPVRAAYVAYCQAGNPLDQFEAKSIEATTAFESCKLNYGLVACMYKPEMHDVHNKVVLAPLIYFFWLIQLSTTFSRDHYEFVLFEEFTKSTTKREVLENIFEFLGVDVDEAYFNKINSGGPGSGGSGTVKCDVRNIPVGASSTLTQFFELYNGMLWNELGREPYDGWSTLQPPVDAGSV